MISRKTTRLLGEFVERITFNGGRLDLYEFLYDRGYDAQFCNFFRQAVIAGYHAKKTFIMRLHTGEAFQATSGPDNRAELGQKYLLRLVTDLLIWYTQNAPLERTGPHIETNNRWYDEAVDALRLSLSLDGYELIDERLVHNEVTVLDTQEAAGAIQLLFQSAGLSEATMLEHHLDLSSDHYSAGKWDDSISNSRKVLEFVLQKVGDAHYRAKHGTELDPKKHSRAVEVRKYLEDAGLISPKEREVIERVYGLLSGTGGHPHIARKDEARLARHLALTLAEFVLLQYEGWRAVRSP